MKTYARFRTWKACHQLALAVYSISTRWPYSERFGLISQARRAAYSAAANIAEGATRRGRREFRRFLDISLGSLAELAYVFDLARDLGFSCDDDLRRLEALREDASKLTWRLYQAMSWQPASKVPDS